MPKQDPIPYTAAHRAKFIRGLCNSCIISLFFWAIVLLAIIYIYR